MAKINLRDIGSRAKQWDHPVKGLFKYAESMAKTRGDILKIPKKDRERYCVSIVALALKHDSQLDWWTHMPNPDPPDGLVMTFRDEEVGAYRGYMREVEVVEHRDRPELIFDTVQRKMVENSYESNTILVCLVLTPAIYGLKGLATRLASITSSIKHVFIVFSGISLADGLPPAEQLRTTYTMTQLLPVFQSRTIDYRSDLDDFKQRYGKGQESRLIEGNAIYFGTTNKSAISSSEQAPSEPASS